MDTDEDDSVGGQNETSNLISSDEDCEENEQYEEIIKTIGYGKFQITLLLICGWALASDSTEVQVL